jgi:hypothetical protein
VALYATVLTAGGYGVAFLAAAILAACGLAAAARVGRPAQARAP